MQRSTQDDKFWPRSVPLAHALGGLDQPRQFSCRVVGRDPTGAVAEQVLAILEAHPAALSRRPNVCLRS